MQYKISRQSKKVTLTKICKVKDDDIEKKLKYHKARLLDFPKMLKVIIP